MSVIRNLARLPRARLSPTSVPFSRQYATQSYGGDESGHPGSGKSKSASSSNQSRDQPSSTNMSHSGASTNKGRPAIHQPESAAEKEDPEVRKHNEEMRNRAEVSANQLSEDDNKVPPGYWKGDVGDPKKSNDS